MIAFCGVPAFCRPNFRKLFEGELPHRWVRGVMWEENLVYLCSRRGNEAEADGPASSRRRLRAGFTGEVCHFLGDRFV